MCVFTGGMSDAVCACVAELGTKVVARAIVCVYAVADPSGFQGFCRTPFSKSQSCVATYIDRILHM